jgi:hypothetical protein
LPGPAAEKDGETGTDDGEQRKPAGSSPVPRVPLKRDE